MGTSFSSVLDYKRLEDTSLFIDLSIPLSTQQKCREYLLKTKLIITSLFPGRKTLLITDPIRLS